MFFCAMLPMMSYLYAFLGSCFVSASCTWGALFLFPRLGLLDFPERYGFQRSSLPYPGGIVFVFLILFFLTFNGVFSSLLAPVILLGGVSVWDDRRPLPAWFRLCIHILVALWVAALGIRIDFVGNPFGVGESFDFSSVAFLPWILTVLWIIAIQNAMNWFDGLRGLSVGVSGIGFLTLGIFSLLAPELLWEKNLSDFTQMSFVLGGLCVGAFFWYWRGKIILGDAGSQVLGFLLAVCSLLAGTKIAVTLLVLSLPILDAGMVVVRRVFFEKKSPLSGDLKHLHHNLSRYWGTQKTTIVLIFLSSVFGAIALFLSGGGKLVVLFLVSIGIVCLNIWAIRGER